MFGSNNKLYKMVYTDQNLTDAWRKVRANKGGPGVDEITVEKFQANLFANLKEIQRLLSEGEYHPFPLKRIFQKKPDGGKRPLGILTLQDRIVQRTVLNVIEPIFDAAFEECSYAFRKGRSTQDAIENVIRLGQYEYFWVVDIDIQSFFDNIDLKLLKNLIKRKIKDREINRLIDLWLMMGATRLEKGSFFRKERVIGILQGGILSPLFANIYLDAFDKEMLQRGFKLVRFCDDILILCKTKKEAKKALDAAKKVLARLNLEINSKKTQIIHFEKGVRFLGENIFLKRIGDKDSLVLRNNEKAKEEKKEGSIYYLPNKAQTHIGKARGGI